MSNYNRSKLNFKKIEKHLKAIARKGKPQWVLANAKKKNPIWTGWQKKYPTTSEVMSHLKSGGVVGIIPRSIDTLIVDADYNEKEPHIVTDKDVRDLGITQTRYYRTSSRKEHGSHWYFSSNLDESFTKINEWKYGDILHNDCFAIMWNIQETLLYIESKVVLGDKANDLFGMTCEPITKIPVVPEHLKKTVPVKALNGVVKANDSITPNGLYDDVVPEGIRNDTLYRRFRDASIIGDEKVKSALVSQYQKSGLEEDELSTCTRSAEKKADEICRTTHLRGFTAYNSQTLSECLKRLNISVSKNECRNRDEICNGDDRRTTLDKYTRDWLFDRIALTFTMNRELKKETKIIRVDYPSDKAIRSLRAIIRKNTFNPHTHWLEESIPPWDGVKRLDSLLTDAFGAENNFFTRWASRYLVLGAIQRAFNPGCFLKEMPILVGPQNIGKSAILFNLLPEKYRFDWFTDRIVLSDKQKEKAEAMLGRLICEISELQGMTRTKEEELKSFISRQDDGIRLAYGEDVADLPRRCIIVGTTNNRECLPNDASGNKRFVPVDLFNEVDAVAWLDEVVNDKGHTRREMFWAEGMVMKEKKVVANLPRKRSEEHKELVEKYRKSDDEAEEHIANLPEKYIIKRSALEIQNSIIEFSGEKISFQRINKGLRIRGYNNDGKRREGTNVKIWRKNKVDVANGLNR